MSMVCMAMSDERASETTSPVSGDIATLGAPANDPSGSISLERLTHAGRAEVFGHFMALDPYDRALRFGGSVSKTRVERYVNDMDFAGDIVLGLRDDEDRLIGLAQICAVPSDVGKCAEIAFSLDPSWRGRGYGKLLMQRVVEWAHCAGITRLIAQVCSENRPMLGVFMKAEMKLALLGDDEVLATLDLDWSQQKTPSAAPQATAESAAAAGLTGQFGADVPLPYRAVQRGHFRSSEAPHFA